MGQNELFVPHQFIKPSPAENSIDWAFPVRNIDVLTVRNFHGYLHRSGGLWSVIVWVLACVISGAVNLDPIGAVNAPGVSGGGAEGKGGCQFDPTLLVVGNGSDFRG